MTNEQKIKDSITTRALAESLITYNKQEDLYYTSDSNGFYFKQDAIEHEIDWLKSEWLPYN